MRRFVLVLLASVLAITAADVALADSLHVAPKKIEKYQQPTYQDYNVIHGRSYTNNTLYAPGTDNRYFSDTTHATSIVGPAFTASGGGWTSLPCTIDVFGCF
jgi:hypothetical protein